MGYEVVTSDDVGQFCLLYAEIIVNQNSFWSIKGTLELFSFNSEEKPDLSRIFTGQTEKDEPLRRATQTQEKNQKEG
ncbi:hypothetical protein Leryth_024060 [Lithospermum erythrorhizon]|nr:hypothetical protein Leryth_024060 [Lithospermum erythrorhizon]